MYCYNSALPVRNHQRDQPLKITLGSFQIFTKIRGDIRKSRCTTGINHNGGKFATCSAGVVDTSGKFATGVNDTGGKFATSVNDAGGKLPPVSTTPAANMPLLSMTPVANNGNNIRLLTTKSELEGKNLSIC
jgi:hypothetical protein